MTSHLSNRSRYQRYRYKLDGLYKQYHNIVTLPVTNTKLSHILHMLLYKHY